MNFMLIRVALALFLSISAIRAEITVSGIIQNSKSMDPIPSVNILDQISGSGTTSDERGMFTLSLSNATNMEIVFKHIAYETYHQVFSTNDTSVSVFMEETLLQMNDVVVTSTRTGYLLRDVPIATEVIGSKEINESGATTVGDLLSQRAGVSTSVNVDGGVIFNMLGLDSRYILILKNNQPISGKFNNRVDLSQISTNRIKKIEIIKGPGSAIYGTEAMGGVINIITEEPDEKMTIDLTYRASSFGKTPNEISNEPINSTINNTVVLPLKNITFSNDLTYQYFKKGQQFEYISADQVGKLNLNTDIQWEISNHKICLSHQLFDQQDEGATRLSNGTILYTNATSIDRNQLAIKHEWGIKENSSVHQLIRKESYKRRYIVKNNGDLIEKDDITEEHNTEYELLFNHSNNSIMVNGGIEFSNPQYNSDRILGGVQDKDIVGVFNQLALSITPDLNIISGVRLDKYGDTTVVSPRLAWSYKPNNMFTYRVAYGQGFRAPSFMESLIDWDHVQFNYTVKGNPGLKPEISKGLTLGAEYTNKNNFQASALIYHNSFSNLIKDYSIEPGVLSYRNIEKAYFTGLDLITKWVINNSMATSFTANYVKNVDTDGNQIPNTIPISIGGRVSYSPSKPNTLFSLSVKGIGEYFPQEYDPLSGDYLSSSTAVKPYLLGDLQVIYTINQQYKMVIGLKNIGNHTNMSYGPYIGRTTYMEINTNIER